MKIMIFCVGLYHYPDSLVRACENAGHVSKKIVIKEFKEEEKTAWKIRLVKWGIKNFERKYEKDRDTRHKALISSFQPDICIVFNGYRVKENILRFIKTKNIKIVLFMLDSLRENYCKDAQDHITYYDQIFSYESTDVNFFIEKCNYIKYLFVGYDESIFYPSQNDELKTLDVCFIGVLDELRLFLLERVAKYAIKGEKTFLVYTIPLFQSKNHKEKGVGSCQDKSEFEEKYPYLSKCIVETPLYNRDLAVAFEKSKICINIHRNNECHTDVNPRTFEILGCRSFQLIDAGHLKNIDLQSGKHLVEYVNDEDLCKKIDYYLIHEKEREEIAKNGYEIAKEKYTMQKSLDIMLNHDT